MNDKISKKQGIIIIIVVICVFIFIGYLKSTPSAPISPEQARKDLIEQSFCSWDGSHRQLEKYIKESMNDPDSYEHIKTTYYDNGQYLLVQTTVRGKNAFGALVKNQIRAKVALDGSILEILE